MAQWTVEGLKAAHQGYSCALRSGKHPHHHQASTHPPHPRLSRPAGRHDMGRYKLQLYAECWTKLRMWELEQWGRWVGAT